jgi:hypothetical protein
MSFMIPFRKKKAAERGLKELPTAPGLPAPYDAPGWCGRLASVPSPFYDLAVASHLLPESI